MGEHFWLKVFGGVLFMLGGVLVAAGGLVELVVAFFIILAANIVMDIAYGQFHK